jgi:hypothetical protein
MPSSTHNTTLPPGQQSLPAVHISYECLVQERGRESIIYNYEVACSITYAATSSHLSLRVTGQNTYRNVAAREVAFTRFETGATTYVELLEAEKLEVRVIEPDGTYCKAYYYAHGQELVEQEARHIVSTIQSIPARTES